jgi:hypothetical protein
VRAAAYVRYWRKAFLHVGEVIQKAHALVCLRRTLAKPYDYLPRLPIDLAHQPDLEASFGHISLVNDDDQSDTRECGRQGFMYLGASANVSDAAERRGIIAQRLLSYN